MNKKIAVLGTGANGSSISADLVRSGHDVTLLDQWPAHVEAMRADGLRVSMAGEEVHVGVDAHHLCDLCALNRTFDVVLLCVKAYDTRWSCELIKPYLAPDGILVGVQNAMTAETIAEVVGPTRTIGCVVELSSELFTPGRVKRNTPPKGTWFGLGALDRSMESRVGEIETILSVAGKVAVTPDILAAKWMKLIVNAMTMGLKSILGATSAEAFKLGGVRELMLRSGEEALAAGQQIGHKVVPVFGLKQEDVEGTNQLLELLLDKITADVGPTAINTVLQDHLKGRYSEVDQINGLVVEENERRGRGAPVNAAIVEVTRRIHAGEITPDLGNLDLVKAALKS